MRPPLPEPCRTALAIAADGRKGPAAAPQALQASLARIASLEPGLHAWQRLDAGGAAAQAARRPQGPLAGVPIAIKDNIDVAGLPTRNGSRLTPDVPATRDAAAVARLRQAGAVVLGKTVMTEYAYFAPGATVNPWHAGHTPGGSSSGSAAAVATGMVPLALGTQTAGSVVRPAAFCGVFGFKQAHDARWLDGIRPFAPSLDTLGWFARSADDIELLRCVLEGIAFEPLPATTSRLACWRAEEWQALDDAGAASWDRGLAALASATPGLQALQAPPALITLVAAQHTLMAFEAARTLHAEWQAHGAAMGDRLGVLIRTGQALTPAVRVAAGHAAHAGRALVETLLEDVDALVLPAAIGPAPEGLSATGDPVFCRVWTLLGLPCISVPGLRASNGLPFGLQLVGRQGHERRLLAAAAHVFRSIAPPAERDAGSVAPAPAL